MTPALVFAFLLLAGRVARKARRRYPVTTERLQAGGVVCWAVLSAGSLTALFFTARGVT